MKTLHCFAIVVCLFVTACLLTPTGLFESVCLFESAARGEDNTATADDANGKPDAALHSLRYKFAAGETLHSKVIHLVTVVTRIQGTSQTAKTRSVATKVWKITQVDADGNVTFVHSVGDVDMWQSVSGRQVVRYNSLKDKQAPVGYEQVAESVGVPLATVKIDPSGRVIERKDNRPQFNPGIGDLTVPLPQKPVPVGHRWTIPDELQVRLPGEPIKRIKTRKVYTLRKVKTGVATIDVRTEVLTPIQDAAIEAQLVQRIQEGTVKFDVDAGRLLSRQMDMDKTVIGFNGPESQMEYLARFTEEMVTVQAAAESTDTASTATTPAESDSNSESKTGPKVAGPRSPAPATAKKPNNATGTKR